MERQGNWWERLTNRYGTSDRRLATCPNCKAGVWAPEGQQSRFYCRCRSMCSRVERGPEGSLDVLVIARYDQSYLEEGRVREDVVIRAPYLPGAPRFPDHCGV